ncbi:MAG TPA: discoidin domain-containing protein, partial [Vicinamibacteria bacterium]|nr:discoidin domain-containing protein [Vicinamibacteria bacterium]
LSPRLRDAYRRGSSFAFYVAAAGVTWLLSLGPNPRLLGMPIWQKAPYFFLMKLPGFSQLRVTARFSMIAALCLAVGASLAFARLLGSLKHGRGLLVALAAVAVLRDGWITRLPLEPAPKRLKILESLPGKDKAVLELPLGGIEDAAAVFRSLYHRVSVVNGYSSYYPPHYAPLLLGLEEEEDDVLTELQSRATVYVVIDRRRDSGGTLERYVSRHRGSRAIGVEDWAALYLLPETPRPALAPGGRTLPIRGIEANAGPGATQMIDGDLGSQWTTGAPQQGHERILIDLGAAQRVGRLEMALGHVTDFPRELLIETSLVGATDWSEVFRGELAGKTLGACLDDPHHLVLRFDLGNRLARFIRLRQLGSDRSNAWSVAEIAVLEGSPLPH